MFFVLISSGKEIGNGIGPDPGGISAQPSGNKEEVQIGSDSKTDRSPGNFGNAGYIGKARQTHQQIGTHVGGFRTHGRHQRAQLTAADIEVGLGIGCALAVENKTDQQHAEQIGDNGCNDHYLGCCHNVLSFHMV